MQSGLNQDLLTQSQLDDCVVLTDKTLLTVTLST